MASFSEGVDFAVAASDTTTPENGIASLFLNIYFSPLASLCPNSSPPAVTGVSSILFAILGGIRAPAAV